MRLRPYARAAVALLVAGALGAVIMRTGGPLLSTSRRRAMVPITLAQPLRVSIAELDRMLHVYTVFVAIGHDRVLASEASMTTTTIEVGGLPTASTRDDLLAHFPAARSALQSMAPDLFTLLDRPEAALFKSGIFVDGEGGRVVVVTGRLYTQDGYGGIASYLEGASQGAMTLHLRFFPGDYGDPGDLDRFDAALWGNLSLDGLTITRVGGHMASPAGLSALRTAAVLFATFEEAPLDEYRFTASDEREAEAVERLGRQVAPGEMSDVRREGATFVVRRRPYDLGLLVAYVRFGKSVLEQ